MTTISAKTVLRSRNMFGPDKVLSTLLLRYPRWIHAEVMTHRMLSRNAASSRAIPVSRLIQDVLDDPAVPLVWGKNQKGMQAGKEHDEPVWTVNEGNSPTTREQAWLAARDQAVFFARKFSDAGYHKQIVNRLLEPFSHITVVVSATEWQNFLHLRDHPDAEPHIRMLAHAIREELDRDDNIERRTPGGWHLPFITDEDWHIIDKIADLAGTSRDRIVLAQKLSVARCASVSYKTVDGFDMTVERAEAIFDKLVGSVPMHASPLEHVAQADGGFVGFGGDIHWSCPGLHGNFVGFCQLRKMLPKESVTG